MGSWKNSACDTSYMGYMQSCIKLQGKGKPLRILSIGGEIQVKNKSSTADDEDMLYDVADVRVLTVGPTHQPCSPNLNITFLSSRQMLVD